MLMVNKTTGQQGDVLSKATIRELTADDAEAFRDLQRVAAQLAESGFTSSLDAWESKSLTEISRILAAEHASHHEFILGAFIDHKLVGMVGFFRPSRPRPEPRGHVWGMFMRPEWRGKGIAGQLMDQLIAHAKKMPNLYTIQLTTLDRSKGIIALYRSRGFEVFATEQQVIRIGQVQYNELYMQLNLKS